MERAVSLNASRSKHIAVVGSGSAAKLCALELANEGYSVSLFAELKSLPEYPVLLPALAIEQLRLRLPTLLTTLAQLDARRVSETEILAERFGSGSLPPTQQSEDIICASSLQLEAALDRMISLQPRITRLNDEVNGLLHDAMNVTGVRTKRAAYAADFVVDATGISSRRTEWLKACALPADLMQVIGPSYVCFTRTYECISGEMGFRLLSHHQWRGGIYPQGEKRFAVSIFVAAHKLDLHSCDVEHFEAALDVIATAQERKRWRAVSPLRRLDGIQNQSSTYFEARSRTGEIQGFVPLGDSLFCSNPVYGRSLASTLLQTRALLKSLEGSNTWDAMRTEIREVKSLWRAGAARDFAELPGHTPFKLLTKIFHAYYRRVLLPLESVDAEFYRVLLRVYQMQLHPVALMHPKFHLRGLRNWLFA